MQKHARRAGARSLVPPALSVHACGVRPGKLEERMGVEPLIRIEPVVVARFWPDLDLQMRSLFEEKERNPKGQKGKIVRVWQRNLSFLLAPYYNELILTGPKKPTSKKRRQKKKENKTTGFKEPMPKTATIQPPGDPSL